MDSQLLVPRYPRLHKALDITKGAFSKLSPRKIYQTMSEDIHNVREASLLDDRKLFQAGPEAARSAINLRMLATLGASEIAGTYICAPLLGMVFQYSTGNAYNGIIGTIAGDYFPSVLTGQITWFALNRGFYSEEKSFFKNLKNFVRDILPAQGIAALVSIPIYALSATISVGFVALSNLLSHNLGHVLPTFLFAEAVNMVITEALYLALFLASAGDAMKKVADRFLLSLQNRFGEIYPH